MASDSNFTTVKRVTESTWGTTPSTPTMTSVRVTGESFKYGIDNIRSEEIRADRLTPDLVQVGARANGGFNLELSYGAFDEEIESLLYSTWQKVADIYNATADSSITDAGTVANTYAVASGGASFKVGHLCRASGFTNSANNQLFRVASSTATTVVGTSLSLTAETAPPAGARLKAVGFQGATADITATASGLGSTLLDFTTLGLAVGQWVKIGGINAVNQFATAALNGWARITAIAATALTLDNRPTGWTTDAGTGKNMQVWFGDYIRPGVTQKSFTYEKSVSNMATVVYRQFLGMIAASASLTFEAGAIVNGSMEFLGKNETTTGSTVASVTSAAPQNAVMNAVSNVARVSEGGAVISANNPSKRVTMNITNNLREQMAIGTLGLISVGAGDFDVTGEIQTYFGDSTLYAKYVAGTATSMSLITTSQSKAYVFGLPNVKFEDGEAASGARNQDVMLTLQYRALLDTTTNTSFQIDRFSEYA
jgi:hypothetical protein